MKANVLSPLMNKWRQLSPVKKASLSLIFAKFFQKGLSMISGPIFTRIMPQSEYGVISTFTSWQSVLYIVATLNMASGVFNNGMVDFKDDRDGFVGSIMSLANICTLTCFVIYLLFKRGIDDILGIPPILTYTMIAYFFVTIGWGENDLSIHMYRSLLLQLCHLYYQRCWPLLLFWL